MERWRRNRRSILFSPTAWLILRPFIRTADAMADGIQTPRCLVLMSKAQGQYPHNRPDFWIPTLEGNQLVLPRAFSKFEAVKSSLNFLCGYDLKSMRVDLDRVDWHHSSATLFNGALLPNSSQANDNVASPGMETIDWTVARRWKTQPLNFSPLFTPGNAPYKTGDKISWRRDDATGAVTAVQCTLSLSQAWNDVFKLLPGTSGTMPTAEQIAAQRRAGIEKSILDRTLEDTQALSRVLSSEQRPLVDQHLTALRELEGRLFATPQGIAGIAGCAAPPMPPAKTPSETQEVLLQRIKDTQSFVLAVMRCGLRPVIGFHLGHMDGGAMKPGLWDNGAQYIPPSGSPEKSTYHNDLWHLSGGRTTGFEWMQRLEERVLGNFADILVGMKGIPAGSSNLLDQSVVLFGSNMSYDHNNRNHSFFMAGSGGGRVKTGRVLKTNDMTKPSGAGDRAHNDVLISTMHALGFGDVTTVGTPALCKGGVAEFL